MLSEKNDAIFQYPKNISDRSTQYESNSEESMQVSAKSSHYQLNSELFKNDKRRKTILKSKSDYNIDNSLRDKINNSTSFEELKENDGKIIKPIQKKKKSITFKKPLREIREVESYKEHNVDVSESYFFCGLMFACRDSSLKISKFLMHKNNYSLPIILNSFHIKSPTKPNSNSNFNSIKSKIFKKLNENKNFIITNDSKKQNPNLITNSNSKNTNFGIKILIQIEKLRKIEKSGFPLNFNNQKFLLDFLDLLSNEPSNYGHEMRIIVKNLNKSIFCEDLDIMYQFKSIFNSIETDEKLSYYEMTRELLNYILNFVSKNEIFEILQATNEIDNLKNEINEKRIIIEELLKEIKENNIDHLKKELTKTINALDEKTKENDLLNDKLSVFSIDFIQCTKETLNNTVFHSKIEKIISENISNKEKLNEYFKQLEILNLKYNESKIENENLKENTQNYIEKVEKLELIIKGLNATIKKKNSNAIISEKCFPLQKNNSENLKKKFFLTNNNTPKK